MSKTGFRELEVWQISKDLAVEIYKVTDKGKFFSDFGLRDQIRRASVSIPSNIAEGDERYSDKESIRFLFISKGSLAELITQLEIAKEIGYMNQEELNILMGKCEAVGKKLGALIKARSNQ